MNQQSFKAKAYLKEGCPHSFKFLLFLTEAGLIDGLEVVRCDPDAPDFETVKARLSAGLGKPATFPTVEIEPGRYRSDSDQLIEHYAAQGGIDANRLPTLAFYKETVFPKLRELRRLKSGKEGENRQE